jgi:arginase
LLCRRGACIVTRALTDITRHGGRIPDLAPEVAKKGAQPMPDNTSGAWDLIATPWHLDEHLPDFPVPAGTTATINPPLPDGAVPHRMTVLHQAIADAVAGAARPLLLSGDCPAGLAVAAGLQRRHREFAVVWLDAHGDFNTPAVTISGYLGGMTVALLTGRAPELLAGPLGLRPVPERNIVLADARDLDPAERDALAASQVRRIPATAGASPGHQKTCRKPLLPDAALPSPPTDAVAPGGVPGASVMVGPALRIIRLIGLRPGASIQP